MQEGFQAGRLRTRIHVVSDGAEAIEYLWRTGRYAPPVEAPRPHLVLLDIHMPLVNGKEVLTRVKQHEELKSIPVVMFTTSSREEDIEFCYAAGANAYLRKPADFDQIQNIVNSITLCWLASRNGAKLSPAPC